MIERHFDMLHGKTLMVLLMLDVITDRHPGRHGLGWRVAHENDRYHEMEPVIQVSFIDIDDEFVAGGGEVGFPGFYLDGNQATRCCFGIHEVNKAVDAY